MDALEQFKRWALLVLILAVLLLVVSFLIFLSFKTHPWISSFVAVGIVCIIIVGIVLWVKQPRASNI